MGLFGFGNGKTLYYPGCLTKGAMLIDFVNGRAHRLRQWKGSSTSSMERLGYAGDLASGVTCRLGGGF